MSSLTADRIRELLDYNPETGAFVWRVRRGRILAGSAAGRIDSRGYVGINIELRKYAAHRLAWLHYYGEWPLLNIDHINRNKTDNRIANLRDVTHSENALNRHFPKRGPRATASYATLHKKTGKWQSHILIDGKYTYCGLFATKEEARARAIETRDAGAAA